MLTSSFHRHVTENPSPQLLWNLHLQTVAPVTPSESALTQNAGWRVALHPKNLHLLLSILRKSRHNMSTTTVNSTLVKESPLQTASPDSGCKHHTRNGRCRMPVADSLSSLCAEHANDFLSRLLLFQAQDRIPPRRRHGLYLQPPPPHPPRHPAGKSRPATENHHRHA